MGVGIIKQLTEPPIIFAGYAGEGRGSIEYSL